MFRRIGAYVLGEGMATPPHQLGARDALSSPVGFGAKHRPKLISVRLQPCSSHPQKQFLSKTDSLECLVTFVKFLPEISTAFKIQTPKTYRLFITNCNLRLLHARTAYAAAPASLPPTATNCVTLSVVLLVMFCLRRMLRPALSS